MVVEAVGGGWGKFARGVWSMLAKSSALASGELQTERCSGTFLMQRLSMTLHRENARACIRRHVRDYEFPDSSCKYESGHCSCVPRYYQQLPLA